MRGILKWAPDGLNYTLFGATSDDVARPPGRLAHADLSGRAISYLPLVRMSASATRSVVPLILRYMWALRRQIRARALDRFTVVDFHRIEPALLFPAPHRPMNVLLHQDMSVLRHADSDIMWRHAPWLYEWMERRMFDRMDRIFAVRQTAVDRYRLLYPAMAERFSFIPTWVDDSIFAPLPAKNNLGAHQAAVRHELGAPPGTKLLTFVGRLDQQKNPLMLIEAFSLAASRSPHLHLALVGDGVMRRKVETAVESRGLSLSVTFCGVKSPKEIARILQASDLFVLSSAYEGMPIAVLEALATGLPVASTDVGEIRRVVLEGRNGFLSRDQSPTGMANAIDSCLQNQGALRGAPCVSSIEPYRPYKVLSKLYENHERQIGLMSN